MFVSDVRLHRVRLILLFVLMLQINCVMDGWPHVASNGTLQALQLPFTLMFLGFTYLFFNPTPALNWLEKWNIHWNPNWRATVELTIVFVLLGAVIFFAESRYYAHLGYRLYLLPTISVFALVLGALFLVLREKLKPLQQFCALIASYVGLEVLSIFSFPLVARRSDMFALLMVSGRELLSGHNPYRQYILPTEQDFCSYLPLNVVAYTPAILLHIDPRYVATVYMVAGAILIYREAAVAWKREVAALVGMFLLCNYFIYRHELYLQIHWLSLIVFCVMLSRGRLLAASAALGVALAISQLTLAMFPFFILYVLQRFGWRKATVTCAVGIGGAALIVGPFVWWSPSAFYYGIFDKYYLMHGINARPMNFTYWLTMLTAPKNLRWFQLTVLGGAFLIAVVRRNCRTILQCLQWMILGLLALVMLNVLIDGYFFLTEAIMLIMTVCIANGYWRGESDAMSHFNAGRGVLAADAVSS